MAERHIVLPMNKEFVPEEARIQSLRSFEKRKQLPGESPHAYLFQLKKLLGTALPNVDDATKETMILHHFIEGLPKSIAQQLRAAPDIKSAQDAMVRARLLMHSEDVYQSEGAAAVVPPDGEVIQRMDKLEHMMEQLLNERNPPHTNSAVALTSSGRNVPRGGGQRSVQCYKCDHFGHIAKYCRTPKCFRCGRYGHTQHRCQGNARGLTAGGSNVNQ